MCSCPSQKLWSVTGTDRRCITCIKLLFLHMNFIALLQNRAGLTVHATLCTLCCLWKQVYFSPLPLRTVFRGTVCVTPEPQLLRLSFVYTLFTPLSQVLCAVKCHTYFCMCRLPPFLRSFRLCLGLYACFDACTTTLFILDVRRLLL